MQSDFDTSQTNWRTNLTGEPVSSDDTELMAQVSQMDAAVSNSSGTGIWDTMNTDPSVPWLWEDAKNWSSSSAAITLMWQNIRKMAVQEQTTASAFYLSVQLQAAIIYAVDWVNLHCYNTTIAQEYDNWWDWEIGSPEALNDLLCLSSTYLPSTLNSACIAAINYFVPDPTVRKASGVAETGANLLDKCFIAMLSGILSQDNNRVQQGLADAGSVYEYVTDGDGYYHDGSFIQHTNVPYTGGYGEVLLSRTRDIFILLTNTSWIGSLENVENIYKFIPETYAPTLYSDIDFDMTRGRGISRETSPAHSVARVLLYDIYFISGRNTSTDYQHKWETFVKSAISSDKFYTDYYSDLSISQIQTLRDLMNNPDVPVENDNRNENKMMASMCQMIHQKGSFACGLSLFSHKITAFEYGNGENKQGWYTGTGMLYVYNADSTQFDENYWPTVNMLRLPGTLTDGQSGVLADWQLYPNSDERNWSGGVSNGITGHASLIYNLEGVTGSSLSAVKSWFMLDDQIIALVAGISGSDSAPVESIIENRQLSDTETQTLQVNGITVPASTMQPFDNATFATLTDEVNQAPLGYVFFEPVPLIAENVSRSGAWQWVNDEGSETVVTQQYATLSVPHGEQPMGQRIAYAILPNYSPEQTQNYQASPPVRIINNDESNQAIALTDRSLWGGNFYQPGKLEFVQATTSGAILIQQADDECIMAFSDPTQSLSEIQFILSDLSVSTVVSKSPEIQIVFDEDARTLSVTMDTSSMNGASGQLVMR
ncbi:MULTISPECIES: polysaccharide lyase 8 family protein [Enterobacterales]|uniref:polysaccharide lyase 8 family protein n=1 Tax=Enterobacterales TaxID=91347 RepID=UPI002ED979CA